MYLFLNITLKYKKKEKTKDEEEENRAEKITTSSQYLQPSGNVAENLQSVHLGLQNFVFHSYTPDSLQTGSEK